MEKQGAKAGKEQGGLGAQGQAVALHQNGNQHRGPKHGEHVLQAQHQHPGRPQGAGVPNGHLSNGRVFFFHLLFSSPQGKPQKKYRHFRRYHRDDPSNPWLGTAAADMTIPPFPCFPLLYRSRPVIARLFPSPHKRTAPGGSGSLAIYPLAGTRSRVASRRAWASWSTSCRVFSGPKDIRSTPSRTPLDRCMAA